MTRLSQKPYILGLGAVFCLSFLLFSCKPVQALSTKIKQARSKDNPAVYFLFHSGHRKKAYLNAETYLSYGNKWSDVKFISASELNSWPEVKLVKKEDSPAIYYIKGDEKTLIASWADLQAFSLDAEPIITVNQTDLDQYSDVSYTEIGLKKTGNIIVSNDLVSGANANTIITSTDGNLMGAFRFKSPQKTATINSITFDFGGLFNDGLLRSAFILGENDYKYNASVNLSQTRRQLVVTFREPLVLSPGVERTVRVFLNMGAVAFDNQTIRIELRQAENVDSDLTVSADFPLKGTEFRILNGVNFLGRVKSQEQSIAGSNQMSSSNRLIGKYILSEESGLEDVLVKNLVFENDGSAGVNDWEDFRLYSDGQIISRASELNSDHDIDFKINYLLLRKGTQTVLTVVAALKKDYDPQRTMNLQVKGFWLSGKTYNASLSPQIINLNESLTLN